MNIDCNVIRDLLPLHIEKLASPETDQLITEHLASCQQCRDILTSLTSNINTTFVEPPTPEPKVEKQLIGRIKRHLMLSKVIFLALGTLLGMYATTKSQMQAPFLVYPLIGIVGELLIGGIWVAPLVVLVVNTLGAFVFWDFHYGSFFLSGVLAFLTLLGSLIAYSGKRVFEKEVHHEKQSN